MGRPLKKQASNQRRDLSFLNQPFSICLLLTILLWPTSGLSDLNLEKEIWSAKNEDLAKFEPQAVRLIQEQPNSAYAHYVVSLLYLKQFKADPSELRFLKQASELGQQAIELDPDSEFGYLIASQVLDLMGYSENSLELLEAKERISPSETWRTSFVKGLLMLEQAAPEDILSEFETSLGDRDAPKELIIPYVSLVVKSGYKPIIPELISWNKRFPHPIFQQDLARAYAEDKRYMEAHLLYTKLQATNPELHEIFLDDAILLYSHLNRRKDAENIFQKILKSKSFSHKYKTSAKAHYATLLLLQNKKDFARLLFIEAISESNNQTEWLAFAHKAYERNKNLSAFVSILDELSFRLPGVSYLYALRGEILSEGLAQHQKAVDSFSDAILLDPRRSEFYNGMGLAYYRMNKHDLALNTFHKALKVDPNDATARYNEACVLSILGRSEEAIGSLKEAIALDARLQDLASRDKDFENIREDEAFQNLVYVRKTTKVP